jgi:hypothetical protein
MQVLTQSFIFGPWSKPPLGTSTRGVDFQQLTSLGRPNTTAMSRKVAGPEREEGYGRISQNRQKAK